MFLTRALFIFYVIVLVIALPAKANDEPYLYVLGVAQDAGYPQAGCYQAHCMPGWEDPSLRRGATSIALIDPAAKTKYLFEATPNLPEQLYALEKEAPSEQYELEGIFLTHAHMGHYAGLMFLGHEAMGGKDIPVYAMPRMHSYLRSNGPWSQLVEFNNIVLQPLADNKAVTLASVSVTPLLVPHRDEFSETVGYLIKGANKSALFIPDINKWSVWETEIAQIIQTVDYALLDATFYGDGELPGRDMSKVPHPLVTETMQALSGLSVEDRNKVWFIHMNHTNPLLNPDSEEANTVRANGFNIAVEGIRLPL
ncbi:MAG TPA: pyrroloquinoline quinone biosynthesis protein PqqB [Porticoccaceae bacterium]|jgi:pyrroloquinoline quinone biosynthesis protein B|nr:pyrroloquinoline quinone biosynthesis protein PqqB [Porticoccaceae bacterium]